MQKQINKLKKVREEIIKKAEKRDETALKRSDDWYNSEKGKKFETATATLADASETLNDAIKELEVFITQA